MGFYTCGRVFLLLDIRLATYYLDSTRSVGEMVSRVTSDALTGCWLRDHAINFLLLFDSHRTSGLFSFFFLFFFVQTPSPHLALAH